VCFGDGDCGGDVVNEITAATIYDAIKHGDEEHREWLHSALDAVFANQPIPAPRGTNNEPVRFVPEGERIVCNHGASCCWLTVVTEPVMREVQREHAKGCGPTCIAWKLP
jgi:hypothetical protein